MSMQLGSGLLSFRRKAEAVRVDKELPRPERQRGTWSFLTWSFFLANFLAATEIIGGSAHAAIVGGDPGDASHSDDAGSYSGVSRPEMQHVTLESPPTGDGNHAAELKTALNPLAGGADTVQGSVGVDGPVAQSHIESGVSGAEYASSSTSPNTTDTYSSSNSHDPTTPINGYGGIDGHDATSNVATIVNAVVSPVIEIVGHVTGVVDDVLHGVGDIADTAIHAVGGLLGDAGSNIPSTIEHLADTVLDTLGDTLGNIGSTAGFAGSVVASAVDDVSGVHDLLGNTLNSLGVSSPGSLSFSAETSGTLAPGDSVASTSAFSQFNLAISDTSHDASASAPASTDTGGITTIIASAIGIGSDTANPASDSDDHGSAQSPAHLTVQDDLHSHLHLGLFG